MNIFNLIKRSLVSRKTADSGQFPTAQVSWSGKTADIEVIYPYGLAGNLPTDSLVLMFSVMGQEENKAGIGNTPKIRFKDLKEGEVAVGNPTTGSVIKFLENGDIEVTGVANQNINITGSQNTTINVNQVNNITGDQTNTIGGNQTDTVTGNVASTISGTLTRTVTGNTTITSPTVTINGNLEVTGDVTAFSGLGTEFSMNNIKTEYNTHVHSENDFPNNTDGPNNII